MAQNCQLCEREITDDQECTTLVCHAHGETVSHTSHTHDKCWERFKKQFVRGRAGNRSSTTFFCPVQGCHNALLGQHTAARKVNPNVDRSAHHTDEAAGSGAGSSSSAAAVWAVPVAAVTWATTMSAPPGPSCGDM